jgi:outer membrane lipoprotein-sorting protein
MRHRGSPVLAAVVAELLFALAPLAARADGDARAILDEAARLDRTTRSWTDRSQRLKIQITDSNGGVRERDLVMKTGRSERRESKTLLVVLGPPDQRGTAILQHSHRDRPSQQWLYIPAQRRKREVSGDIKNQKFVGSDFTVQDLEILSDAADWTETEVHSELIGEETIDGRAVHVIELTPGEKSFGYAKLRIALTKDDLLPRWIEMFDADGNPQKRLAIERFETIKGIPTPLRLDMKPAGQSGGSVVELSDVRYDQNLPDSLFDTHSLERGLALGD